MKIVTIVGARPQFVKAATISRVIREYEGIRELSVHTGQHFDSNMSDIFFEELNIPRPDYHLGIGGGTHGQNTGRMIEKIESVLMLERPDWVIVFGDTDSTLAGALAAVKLHIPISHIEAGLRSMNRKMPEEINRILTDHISHLLFAPTQTALENLRAEGIYGDRVCLSGDVMYDAVLFYQNRIQRPTSLDVFEGEIFALCTVHRDKNIDNPENLNGIVELLNELSTQMRVVLPIHPRTKQALDKLNNKPLDTKITVIEPVGYLEMCWLLTHCRVVLTDSGGLQKEAYFYKKPCITIREETEWVELLEVGCNRLFKIGIDKSSNLLEEVLNQKYIWPLSLYGSGNTAQLIIDKIKKYN